MKKRTALLVLLMAIATAVAMAQSDSSSHSASTPDPQTMPTNADKPQSSSVDDASLQQGVKQQLSSDPAFAMVQAAVHNGNVELTGSVPTKADRKKAEDMAKAVPGVKKVKEHLSVGGGTGSAKATPTQQDNAGSIYGNTKGTGTQSSSNPGAPTPPAGSTPPTMPQSTTPPHS